jgi:hypothetical protein
VPAWLIWLIVIVVVVLAAVALYAATSKRRTEKRRERADALREEASTHAATLPESQREAEEARAKADLARTEAQRAEQEAATAEQGHRIEQASYEDKLREADRLDPDVDHKAPDYEPDVWNDEGTDTAGAPASTLPTRETSGPRHAAPVENPTVAQRTEDPEAEAVAASESDTTTTRRPTEA